jgi:hypothetical protein
MVYSKPLYGILSVYIPLSIVILWSPLPGLLDWLMPFAPSAPVSFNAMFWCISAFLSAAAASL